MTKVRTINISRTVNQDFPFVENFCDYDDISDKTRELAALFSVTTTNAEIGKCCTKGYYWAVFYIDSKPSKVDIAQLLEEAGYVEEGDDG